MKVPTALTIAGSDPSGGAGIQADLKTFLACGVHGMSAITALTAQNTLGVSGVRALDPDFVREQIRLIAEDIPPDAAKTGMLANRAIVEVVAQAVADFGITNLVVDPVFISKSGHDLLESEAVGVLKSALLPLAAVLTPNLYEAAGLTGLEVTDLDGMRRAAEALHKLGPANVLVKGGHLGGSATDVLFDGESFTIVSSERFASRNTHGTGCTLSAAIAAQLARGNSAQRSVQKAKHFVAGAIRHGLELGGGHGPTNHGWASTMRTDGSPYD